STSTVSPAVIAVASVIATSAVVYTTGNAAAWLMDIPPGRRIAMSPRTTAYSANPPHSTLLAIRSPSARPEFAMAETTVPAISWPGTKGRGGRTWEVSATHERWGA